MLQGILLIAKAAFVLPILKVSLALAVLAIGLDSHEGDALWLVRHPALLARSILSINIIVPLVALAVTQALDLPPAIRVALVALSISPVPPVLPRQTGQAGGEAAYAIGLLTFFSLAAILLVPISVGVLAALFGASAHLAAGPVALLMGETVLVPLGVGLTMRHFTPRFAGRVARPVNVVSMVVLAVAFLLVLVAAWPAMRSFVGNGTLLAVVIVTALALFVGHELGGPVDVDRPVLALASALRHPAVAIAVGTAAFPSSKLVAPAVLLQFVVAAIASAPYSARLKRIAGRPPEPASTMLRSPTPAATRHPASGAAGAVRKGRSR
jgi:BASS family bile acid:Na+ symporter